MTTTSADSVSVTSRHTVRCANEASWTALDSPFRLGPFDQLVSPSIPVAVVFVYKQPALTIDTEIIPVERLQRALTLLLDYYPHLTGRLQIDPSDGTPEITRLGTGAELFVAQCSERLDALSSSGRILMPSLPAAGNALFAPFDAALEGVCRDPIFTVQHTRFACGGVALGVRLLHKVCDADGFFQLVRDLAELYRGIRSFEVYDDPTSGVPSLTHPPHIRPYMSELIGGDMAPEERQAALDVQPSLFHVQSSTEAGAGGASFSVATSSPSSPAPIVGRFMRFSSRELSALKTHATDPNSGGPSSDSWISTFDALSAHLYQSVYRARLQLRVEDPKQGEMSPPNFLTPVNVRNRFGLPPRYFPNALICTYTGVPPDVLASGPLWQVAKVLHDLTRTSSTTSKEEMNQTLKWIAMQPDKQKIRQGFLYGNGSLMISQWNKVDMYAGTRFEVPPTLVSTPFTPISLVDGLAYFLPTEEQGTAGDTGAIDVNLSLSEPLWGIIDQDEEFRRFRDA
ncbi:hypothetical protein BOTBODRAFT_34444 [Botryobasidium botryosum FD-172 SS1]|uniref:Transferase n=1 Tax=Botryobasidium botryosum (strain FD-172 SS1) TaxID=930990 RepID=A0A067MLM5_BOTB1|nr:hypothetical protein BOTBODRAFT_34444 [Botryobasidium botryosum FD-172 SS1]